MIDIVFATCTTRTIASWEELSALCRTFAIGDWIFRGHVNGAHQLIPAIGRVGARRSLSGSVLPYDRAQAEELLRLFKLHAHPHVGLAHDVDDLQWWALGRHHGLPTPFLDWTTSFLIAAYFACKGGGMSDGNRTRAAIYAVKQPKLVDTYADAINAPEVVAYLPPHVSPRIGAQSALLTFHPRPDIPWSPEEIQKIWIPSDQAIAIKVILTRAGIHEASIQPGLDGVAQYLGWLYKREFLRQISDPQGENDAIAYTGENAAGGRGYVSLVQDGATASDRVEP